MATKKLWGGRFSSEQDPLFAEFNDSFSFDLELLEVDIQGSLAYAEALVRAGVLSTGEERRVARGLRSILEEHRANTQQAKLKHAEDVHTYVEQELAEKVGALALKLHTGRSRNDQVATDLRLYLNQKIQVMELHLGRLLETIAGLAERNVGTILPGYTHLQRAQPVLFSHYLLAYGEMLLRDRQRLREAGARTRVCPLGSGALSGTVYRIDRAALARRLGFDSVSENSMDAVSDRDFVLDFLFFASSLMIHLSRLSEDLILYSSAEFGFIKLDDSIATGSSLMPQKKNPDALELIRGKAGRVAGHFVSLLMVLKGLPMSYNKDLQEDKEGLFDVIATVEKCVRMMQLVLERIQIKPNRMREAGAQGYLNATELADYLVAKEMPFREAHDLVGRIVLRASALNLRLEELPLEEYLNFSHLFSNDLYRRLSLTQSVARRRERGGTAPSQVRKALKRFRRRIASGTHAAAKPDF